MLPSSAGLQVDQARSDVNAFCTLQCHHPCAEGINGCAFKHHTHLPMPPSPAGKRLKLKELLMAPTAPRWLERDGDGWKRDEKQQVSRGEILIW